MWLEAAWRSRFLNVAQRGWWPRSAPVAALERHYSFDCIKLAILDQLPHSLDENSHSLPTADFKNPSQANTGGIAACSLD